MSQDIFLNDSDTKPTVDEVFTPLLAIEDAPRQYDNILIEKLLADKEKPRENLLATPINQENVDPYAEFTCITRTVERKVRSPVKGFAFFTPKSVTPTVRAQSSRSCFSLTRRDRLLKKANKLFQTSISDDEDAYSPPGTFSFSKEVAGSKEQRVLRCTRLTSKPESPDIRNDTPTLENTTPRRSNLRPRKRKWLDEEDIPLQALGESLLIYKKEREEKRRKAEEEIQVKRQRNTSANPTPKKATLKQAVTPKTPKREPSSAKAVGKNTTQKLTADPKITKMDSSLSAKFVAKSSTSKPASAPKTPTKNPPIATRRSTRISSRRRLTLKDCDEGPLADFDSRFKGGTLQSCTPDDGHSNVKYLLTTNCKNKPELNV